MESKIYNGKTFNINERGFWESSDRSGHVYDSSLCIGLIKFFQSSQLVDILDLGCGTADYTKQFISKGFKCEAYDGNPNTNLLTEGIGNVLDFSYSFDLKKKFDCVLSLEVGEHIPKEYEKTFLDNVCNHSKNLIVLSWAVVGQGGDGHVNCQNNDYVIEQLKLRGFDYEYEYSNSLRNSSTASWFKNTIMVFRKNG